MDDKRLKAGLRQLADQQWPVVKITDEFLEGLFRREDDPPSEELKEHFLLRLRARIDQIGSPRYSGYEKK
jgi:hypothetical protein